MFLTTKKSKIGGLILSACIATVSTYSTIVRAETLNKTNQIPEWMDKIPTEPGVIYATGIGTSMDMSFADSKALNDARAKLCDNAGAKITAMLKTHTYETEQAFKEDVSKTTRNVCAKVSLKGAAPVEMFHLKEGNKYISYALMSLPIQEPKLDDQQNIVNNALIKPDPEYQKRVSADFEEMDKMVGIENEIKIPIISPVEDTKAKAIKTEPQKISSTELKVGSVIAANNTEATIESNGKRTKIALVDSTNSEYLEKRNAALQKPNAVILQTTVQ
jgi:hypothetical protein